MDISRWFFDYNRNIWRNYLLSGLVCAVLNGFGGTALYFTLKSNQHEFLAWTGLLLYGLTAFLMAIRAAGFRQAAIRCLKLQRESSISAFVNVALYPPIIISLLDGIFFLLPVIANIVAFMAAMTEGGDTFLNWAVLAAIISSPFWFFTLVGNVMVYHLTGNRA